MLGRPVGDKPDRRRGQVLPGPVLHGRPHHTAVNFTTDSRSISLAEQTLTPGATYKWRVRAVDGSGIPLAWSAEQIFVAPTAPGPTVTTLAASGATPVLEWTPTAAQQSYEVEIYKGTDPTFPVASKVASPVSTRPPRTPDSPSRPG